MNKSYKKIITCLLLLLPVISALSQDISGTWIGNYGWSFGTTKPQKLVVEIYLYNDSLITGASHLYYRNNKNEHYRIRGIYRKKDSSFIFKEDSAIAIKLGFFSTIALGTYKTKLSVSDTAMRQEGKWRDNARFLGAGTCSVWLEKMLPITKKEKMEEEDTSTTLSPVRLPEKLLERETDIQSLVEVPARDKDSIKIAVYDNGTIDDDSVSIYADNNPVLTRQRISSEPLVFFISLDKNNPISNIRLVAESLGSIPPCTALMIITTKHNRYEVNLSSNMNKNATIELFLKE